MGKFSSLRDLVVEPVPTEITTNGNLEEALQKAEATRQRVSLKIIHRSRFQKYPPATADIEKIRPSIAALGILEDLLVRPHPDLPGELEILAGHTRYEVALLEKLNDAPIKVFDASDEQAVEIVTATNLQRRVLNPIAETDAILELLCVKLKRSRSEVLQLFYQRSNNTNNVVRTPEWQMIETVFETTTRISPETFRVQRVPLLKLPTELLEAVRQGQLEYTKAREIARVPDVDERQRILDQAIAEGLSLTQIRQLIAPLLPSKPPSNGFKAKATQTLQQLKKADLDPARMQQVNEYLDRIQQLIDG
jgi:ParB family chromosome partitioning protein